MSDALTQDLYQEDHTDQDESFTKPKSWGHMFSVGANYPFIELIDDHYTVGRIGTIILPQSCAYYSSISKIHFEIMKEGNKVMITDKSANGTFIDGVKIGKNKTIEIGNNSEISICCKKNKAFIFTNLFENQILYPEIVNKKYRITKKIGSGAYGEVNVAFRKSDQSKLAVKIIERKKFFLPGKSTAHQIETEANILRQLSHPCIIKLLDAIATDDKLFLFMDLVEGGELFDRVIALKQFNDKDAKVIFYQMVLAIKYLHEHNICHRDLKPENILLCSEENCTLIKVTDFGLSKFLDGKTMLRTMCGTPNYLAPEVLLCDGNVSYTAACDVWSLGVILFVCLVGYPPFSEENSDVSLRDQIITCKVTYPPVFWRNINDNAVRLVQQILVVDADKRISIDGILSHPWLDDASMRDVVKALMRVGDVDVERGHSGLSDEPIIKKRKL